MKHLLLLTLFLIAPCVYAESAQEKGLAIAIEMDERDRGWLDQQANLVMLLRNKQGQESTRQLRVKSLEVVSDGDESLTIFDSPPDVKGTAFLSFSHPLDADDQWIYLPSIETRKANFVREQVGAIHG